MVLQEDQDLPYSSANLKQLEQPMNSLGIFVSLILSRPIRAGKYSTSGSLNFRYIR